MDTETTTIVVDVIEQAWNQGDVDALDHLVAQDYLRHMSDGRTLQGRDAFKERIRALRATMPDMRMEIGLNLCDGSLRTTTFTFSATSNGSPVKFEGALVGRVADGKLAEAWEYFNPPQR